MPEADDILVNDLDLIVQMASSQLLYNPNQGIKTTVEVFEPFYGNDAMQTNTRDRSNVIEEVFLMYFHLHMHVHIYAHMCT